MASPPHLSNHPAPQPEWASAGDGLRAALQPSMLMRSAIIALIVGTLLSLINQGHLIIDGDADGSTWARVGANYVIPFIVSMAGALWALRAPSPRSGRT